MENNANVSIKYRIITPTIVILFIVLGAFMVGINQVESVYRGQETEDDLAQFDSLYTELVAAQAEFLEGQLHFLVEDEELIEAFVSRDRDVLLEYVEHFYEELNEEHGVTHFYFTDADRVNFLRVHNPPSNGDTINRFTTLEAERTGELFYGIEIGASGLFTLRVVAPWEVGGERIGYMELGIEIDHLITDIQHILNSELVILVKKSHLDRERFEAGMTKMGREVVWDKYTDLVVVDDTLGIDLTQAQVTEVDTLEQVELYFDINDRQMAYVSTPFINVAGETVGSFLIGHDTTEENSSSSNLKWTLGIAVLLVGALVTVAFYFYLNRIENQQDEANERLWLASKDIEQRIQAEQEQRAALEKVNADIEVQAEREQRQREQLTKLINQIQALMGNLNASVAQIQASATEQMASAAQQNTAVTQTVATVEEVRATVQQTAESAGYVSDSAQHSIEISRQGQQAVSNSIEGMQLIQSRVEDIAQTILALSERTQQISEIIETVNALADQSKLLALNASIEAARAGEEGRGFAVVAMEVRELAEQSRQATSRISEILNDIQQTTNTAVMVTEEGSKQADTGMNLAQDVSTVIEQVSATLEDMGQTAVQIAASTQQQTNGMDQLATAMMQIKQASEQTAEIARQSNESMRELMDMAQELEETARSVDNGNV